MYPTRSTELASEVLSELENQASPAFAASQRRSARRGAGTFMGVPAKDVKAIAKYAFAKLPDHSIDPVHKRCEAFLSTNIYELKAVALYWCFECKAQAGPHHINVYGRWLKTYIDEWRVCDGLCIHAIGTLFLKYPETLHVAKSWARDSLWVMRRAAAVSLLPAAREGRYIDHILDIAELLQKERDRLVQYGIGRLLRTAATIHEKEILDFLEDYRRTMSPAIIKEASRQYSEQRSEQRGI